MLMAIRSLMTGRGDAHAP